ncbi:MAG: hypothetical protein WCF18_10260 [Chthoniobacteraceae bacterium]
MKPRLLRSICCLAAGALTFLSGCATGGGAGRYIVTAPKSPFYKYGPAQAFGADFALDRGQKVTVVENSFGFSKVTTDDGLAGYMATEDLAPSPDPVPQVRAPARTASRRVGSGAQRAPSYVEPGLPLFDGSDIPLPSKVEPPKKAAPHDGSDLPSH